MLNRLNFIVIIATAIGTTLAYGTVHQPVIALFYLMTAMVLVVWATDCLTGGRIVFSTSLLQVPLVLLGFYAVVQAIPFGTTTIAGGLSVPRTISLEPFATKLTAVHIFALSGILFAALATINSSARLKRLAIVLTLFGFVYAFYAILQSVLSPDKIYGIYDASPATPFGSFVNRHNFAAMIVMLASLPIGLLFSGVVPGDKRLLCVIAIALMVSALLLSGSRGGLVAFAAEIILLLLLTHRARGRKNLLIKAALTVLLFVAAVGGAIFVGGDTSLTRFSDAAATNNLSSSRNVIWANTLKVISAHFPLGAGLGAYAQAYTRHDTSSGLERVEHAHNDYLQIVADAGIVGAGLGGLFLYLFIREGHRRHRESNPLRRALGISAFAGCSAILVHSIFDFVLHITAVSVMFLILLAILIASGRKFDDEDEEQTGTHRPRRRSRNVTRIHAS